MLSRPLPRFLTLLVLSALFATLVLGASAWAADRDEDAGSEVATPAQTDSLVRPGWILHFGVGSLYWTPDTRTAAERGGSRPEKPVGKRKTTNSGRRKPVHHDVSAPLGSMHGKSAPGQKPMGEEPQNPSVVRESPLSPTPDTAVQESADVAAPPSSASFDGSSSVDGYIPPDTNGDVGGNYIVEWVNTTIDIFNKTTHAEVVGPIEGNTIWSGFGGACEDDNAGDPIVKYDRIAKRWILTQFAFGFDFFGNPVGPYYQCIAVSTSSDPTGSYYRYAYLISDTVLNDYPKVGIWNDGYWFTFNDFDEDQGFAFVGATVAVADREAMINGDADAAMLVLDLPSSDGGLLPADLDGTNPPPDGAAETFAQLLDNLPSDGLQLYTATPNWGGGTISWSTGDTLLTAGFSQANAVSQPGTAVTLDPLSDRLMYRLAYRNLGASEIMVVTHSVNATGVAAPRWYQLARTTGSWSLAQQSTFRPDSTNRWMGSIASDHDGNLALGYSKSSGSVYPSAAYTGRLATDALGTMRSEIVYGAGAQPQRGGDRWGDYSSVTLDPDDDCTFWIFEEYFKNTGAEVVPASVSWHTRIGSFRFPGCIAYEPHVGWVGDEVVIQGSRYESATSVKFGGVNAAFSVDSSAHTVTATVPLGAQKGPVSIVTPGGTFTSGQSFTPGLELDSLSDTDGVPGDVVTITGRGFGAVTQVKFGNGVATTFTKDSDTQITATVPTSATTGKVTVVAPNGISVQSDDTYTLIQAITGFTPTQGPTGTTVTVTGSTLQGATVVRFGGVASTSVSNVTSTSLKAVVPPNAVAGPISVTTPNGTVVSDDDFIVVPKFSNLSPSSAGAGATVAFNGSGLAGAAAVSFNGAAAAFVVVSGTKLNLTVPADATTGLITVTLGSGQSVNSTTFKPTPKITGFSQPNAETGTTITVNGSNFLGATTLKLGSLVLAPGGAWSVDDATHITVTLPSNAVTGKFSVTTPAGTGSSAINFGVLAHIDLISPTEAKAGTTVTFTGRTFVGVAAVKFNGASASSKTVVNSTTLKAVVPTGATSGPVTVVTAGGTATGPTFTIDPKITGLSLTSGVAGTTVTINGSGLGGTTQVQFNGVDAASIVSVTPTQVKATVPGNATKGTVSVTTPAGSAASTAVFSPLPKITGFSPTSGPRGTAGVVLTGTNFLGATLVKIGAVTVTTFSVDDATHITLTIPSAASTARFRVTTPAGSGTSATSFTVTASMKRSAPHRSSHR